MITHTLVEKHVLFAAYIIYNLRFSRGRMIAHAFLKAQNVQNYAFRKILYGQAVLNTIYQGSVGDP
jgi:hypothetical protein